MTGEKKEQLKVSVAYWLDKGIKEEKGKNWSAKIKTSFKINRHHIFNKRLLWTILLKNVPKLKLEDIGNIYGLPLKKVNNNKYIYSLKPIHQIKKSTDQMSSFDE